MPYRIETYEQALDLIGISMNEKVQTLFHSLESEGRKEKSICFAIWKSQEKICKFKGDSRFYSILSNEIRKWSWGRNDRRWDEYSRRKEEEQKAAEMQKQSAVEKRKETIFKNEYPGFVYFIQGKSGGPIKIGYTTDLESRLKTLQTGFPDTLTILCSVHGKTNDETLYHQKFEKLWVRGEWYRPEEPLLSYIRSIQAHNKPVYVKHHRAKKQVKR